MDATEGNTYIIRPNFKDKFRPQEAQQIVHEVLVDFFSDKAYDGAQALAWTSAVCEAVKARLKELQLPRYKYAVQAMIGEQRGEGVKMAARCLWDSDTDNYTQDVYLNDSLFCVCAAFAVYYY